MNYLKEVKEIIEKYKNSPKNYSIFLKSLKAKIEAEGCDEEFEQCWFSQGEVMSGDIVNCGDVSFENKIILCPDCQQALKEIDEVSQ